ncbi:MAG: hypothetical protein EZS28_005380 [Streblomastix strix]|uniref:Uncharacterized protein n=1 Tax=Streblomastix strix TaxID=222440 RepID=A0A5J4WW80_9EUKA|nr:MAG: hypothetical protein EZS28_005380 [Streblomastix strix]
MAYGRWQTKIAGVSRICSVPFLVPPRQITSFTHSVSTHTLMVEQIRVPFSKGLPYFNCMDNSYHSSTPLINRIVLHIQPYPIVHPLILDIIFVISFQFHRAVGQVSKQRLESRKRAKHLRTILLVKKFSHFSAIPSSSYVRKLCADNNIRFCKASSNTSENDIDPRHVILTLHIARGFKQPSLFFIIVDLTYVPLRIYEMTEAEAFFDFMSKRGFMTKVLFREWSIFLINQVLEQKLVGYYAQDKKIILLLTGIQVSALERPENYLKKKVLLNQHILGTNISYATS